jgi:hypothetical protein
MTQATNSTGGGGSIGADMRGAGAEAEYVFEVSGGRFWKRVAAGEDGFEEWIELREGAMRRDLAATGLSPKAEGGAKMSAVDARLHEIEQGARVVEARRLAGYRVGKHTIGGDTVLVPRALRLLDKKRGEWLCLAAFMEGLLDGDDEDFAGGGAPKRTDQRDYAYAWLQDLLRSLYGGYITSGPAFCIAGVPNCGKTRLLNIVRILCGDRVGLPYKWMIGRDDFNQELFGAALWQIDDETVDTSGEARAGIGAWMKKIAAGEELKCRGMQRDGFNVRTTRRLFFSLNLAENDLKVLPQLTDGVGDKMSAFKGYARPAVPAVGDGEGWAVYRARYPATAAWWDHAIAAGMLRTEDLPRCWPMPMPADTVGEQGSFWAQIVGELPAFAWWLCEDYVAPSHVTGGRFRVRTFHHAEIVDALRSFDPHVHLWSLLMKSGVVWRECTGRDEGGRNEWRDREYWEGSTDELRALLTGEMSQLSEHEKRELPKPVYLGVRIGEAKTHWGEGVAQHKRTNAGRFWVLRPSPEQRALAAMRKQNVPARAGS